MKTRKNTHRGVLLQKLYELEKHGVNKKQIMKDGTSRRFYEIFKLSAEEAKQCLKQLSMYGEILNRKMGRKGFKVKTEHVHHIEKMSA